jgi:hypothetical protein
MPVDPGRRMGRKRWPAAEAFLPELVNAFASV